MAADGPTTSLSQAKTYIAAQCNRDRGALDALYADNVVVTIPLSASGDPAPWNVFAGKAEAMAYIDRVHRNFCQIHFNPVQYTVSQDAATVFFEGTGHLVADDGRRYINVYVIKFHFDSDGRIAELWEYANPVAYAKFAGLPLARR